MISDDKVTDDDIDADHANADRTIVTSVDGRNIGTLGRTVHRSAYRPFPCPSGISHHMRDIFREVLGKMVVHLIID